MSFAQNFYNSALKEDSIKLKISINPFLQEDISLPESEILLNMRNEFLNDLVFDSSTALASLKFIFAHPDILEKGKGFRPSEMLTPLANKYYNDNRNAGFKYVLGMIQTAAVGYLAYKHISKYGFFKKKDDN